MYNGKPEPRDAWTKLVMRATLQLIETNNPDFTQLDPVIAKENQRIINQSVRIKIK